MQTLDAIHGRRSIRKYQVKKISEKEIKVILSAGMSGPSAMNVQSWRFIVIDDEEKLQKIGDIHPYAPMIKQAPLAIVVCGDTTEKKAEGFWCLDCSAAIQNMLLASYDMGIGSVWTGIHPDKHRVKDFVKFFSLPKHITPHSLVIFGYPAEEKEKKDGYDENKVHYNKW